MNAINYHDPFAERFYWVEDHFEKSIHFKPFFKVKYWFLNSIRTNQSIIIVSDIFWDE